MGLGAHENFQEARISVFLLEDKDSPTPTTGGTSPEGWQRSVPQATRRERNWNGEVGPSGKESRPRYGGSERTRGVQSGT